MSVVGRHAKELRSLADRLRSTSEQSRSTFTDESRPVFDERVVGTTGDELRGLAGRVDELDSALDRALRLLD